MAPFGEIVRYIRERDAAEVTAKRLAKRRIEVNLTQSEPLPPQPVALTLRVGIPSEWTGVVASLAGNPIHARTYEERGGKWAIFDVLPTNASNGVSVLLIGGP